MSMHRPPVVTYGGDTVYALICLVLTLGLTLLAFAFGSSMLEQYRISSTEANQTLVLFAVITVPILLLRFVSLRNVLLGRRAGFDLELACVCVQMLVFVFVLVSRALPLILIFPVLFVRLLYILRRRSGALGPALR